MGNYECEVSMPGKELVQSLVRAMDILECVSRGRFGCRLADISEELKLNPTTAYNLMRTLAERGYLFKDSSNRYRLGPAFKELTRNETRNHIMSGTGRELLNIAAKLPGSVSGLVELCGPQIRVVLRVSPDRPGVVAAPLAFDLPVYTTSSGLCFLMQSEYAPTLFNCWPFDEYGRNRWKTKRQLEAFLRECRKQGFVQMALDDSMSIGLAEPVAENMVLNIRTVQDKHGKAAELLHECAARIRNDH